METTQLSEALEHRSDDNNSDNDDSKISEDKIIFPAIENNNKDDSDLTYNNVEHLKILEDTSADLGEERKLSEVKVYALCCALVVLCL